MVLLGLAATPALAEQSALKAVMKWEEADFLSSACYVLDEWPAASGEAVPRQLRDQLERFKTAVATTTGIQQLQTLVAPGRRSEEADKQLAAYREQLGRYRFGPLRHIFSYGATVYAFVAMEPTGADKPLVASFAFTREGQNVTGFDPNPASDSAQALLFRWYYSKFGPDLTSAGSRCNAADLARLTHRLPVTGGESASLLVRGAAPLAEMPAALQRWFAIPAASRSLAAADVWPESWRRIEEYRATPAAKDFDKQLIGDRLLFWFDLGPLVVAYTRLDNGTVRPAHFFADGDRWRLGHVGLSNMTTRVFDRRELAEAALQEPPFTSMRRSR